MVGVQVGAPQIQPQVTGVQVGRPVIDPHGVSVAIGTPQLELPANPAHHQPYRAQAIQAIEYGRRAGWHPQQTHAVLMHLKSQYDAPPAITIAAAPAK